MPLALLALAGLSLVGWQSAYTQHIAPTIRHHVSQDAFGIANRTALKVMHSRAYFWATLGFLITLWGVGASLRSMMRPLNEIYGARETRSWMRRLLVSLGGALLVIAFLFAVGVVVLAGRLVYSNGLVGTILFFVRWFVAFLLLLATIAVVIRVVPAKKRPFRWVSIGSFLSALCWVVATIGFGLYISTVSYSSIYGGLGSAILLLIYLHVSAIAFLLGVSVDSQLRAQERRTPRRGRARTPVGT